MWNDGKKKLNENMYILTHYVYENICNVRKILTKMSFFSTYLFIICVSSFFMCFIPKLSGKRELFKVSLSCLCCTELSNAEMQFFKILSLETLRMKL